MDAIVIPGGIPQPEEPLYPYSHGDSKALIDVAGKPMVQWILDALSDAKSVDNVIVIGLSAKNGLSCKKPIYRAAGVVGQVNAAQSNFLKTIRSNVDRMATLVSDLADVSRIEANRLRLDFQAVDLVEMMDEIKRSAHAQIEAKDQVLHLDIPSDIPDLWGDRVRLIQVLTNLNQ